MGTARAKIQRQARSDLAVGRDRGAWACHAPASRSHRAVRGAPPDMTKLWFNKTFSSCQAYVDWCLAQVQAQRIGLLIPGKEAVRIAAAQPAFNALGCQVLSAAPPDSLRCLRDKALFYARLDCCAAPPPEARLVRSLAAFDVAYAELRCRHAELCIKPTVSVYGIGFRRIREQRSAYTLYQSGVDYQVDMASLRQMLRQAGQVQPLLLMQYVPGHGYSVDVLADQGSLHCAVARKKSLTGQEGQRIDARADIQTACRQLVAQFELNGLVNVQFKLQGPQLHVLEVNARASGGVPVHPDGGLGRLGKTTALSLPPALVPQLAASMARRVLVHADVYGMHPPSEPD